MTARQPRFVAALLGVVLALSACAPEDEGAAGSATTAADSCAKDKLQLTTAGKLTIGTDKPAYDDHVPSARQRERERLRRRAARRSALVAAASTVVLGTVVWLVVTRSPGWPRVRESFFNWDYAKSSFPSILAGSG